MPRRRSPLRPAVVGLMARAPRPGRAKTRLAGQLGLQAAAELASACLRDTAEMVASTGLPLAMVFTPRRSRQQLHGIVPGADLWLVQTRGDLGRRLLAASTALLSHSPRVIMLAADNPTLPAQFLSDAVAALEEHDVVLGPTDDGGYYLIGLKRPLPALFTGIPWSTDQTSAATAQAAEAAGLRLRRLPSWYDLDVPSDLSRLEEAATSAGPVPWPAVHVRAVLRAASQEVA